jgi:hypothetical protein
MNDGSADLCGEGEPTDLIIYDVRADPAVCESGHGAYEVMAFADHPAGP